MTDLPPWLIWWLFAAAVLLISAVTAAIAVWIEKRDPL